MEGHGFRTRGFYFNFFDEIELITLYCFFVFFLGIKDAKSCNLSNNLCKRIEPGINPGN